MGYASQSSWSARVNRGPGILSTNSQPRSGRSFRCQVLRNKLVGRRGAIGSTDRALNSVSRAPGYWFKVEGIFLSASAEDFYWDHGLE